MKNIFLYLFGKFLWVKLSNDFKYKGSWKKGRFHGNGTLKYKNGSLYRGSFLNGAKNGYGTFISISGFEYHGQWYKGKQTGKGQAHYKNGDIYTGYFLDGLKHGFGEIFTIKDQRNYKGHWNKDKITGECQVTSSHWVFYGIIDFLSFKAEGKLTYKDGSEYIGSLKDFEKNGFGKFTHFSGETYTGDWQNNVSVIDAKKIDNNGFVWEGSFKDLNPDGILSVKSSDQKKYGGMWSNGSMLRAIGSIGMKTKPFIIYH